VVTDRPVAATSLYDTTHPVHPLVPDVWFEVPVTVIAPPAADSLYAEYTGFWFDAVVEASSVYPAGSVQVTAAAAGRCSKNAVTTRSPAVPDPVAAHV